MKHRLVIFDDEDIDILRKEVNKAIEKMEKNGYEPVNMIYSIKIGLLILFKSID